MDSPIMALVAVFISGLIGYFIIGRIVDIIITRLGTFPFFLETGISIFILNFLKPMFVTLSIFGFGAFVMKLFHGGQVISIVGFIYLFLLTCPACLSGRFIPWSKIQAIITMVVVMISVISAYYAS